MQRRWSSAACIDRTASGMSSRSAHMADAGCCLTLACTPSFPEEMGLQVLCGLYGASIKQTMT